MGLVMVMVLGDGVIVAAVWQWCLVVVMVVRGKGTM